MRRHELILFRPCSVAMIAILFMGALLCPLAVHAQSQAQYTTTLPVVSNTSKPNILLLLDNSGSMEQLAAETLGPFDPTITYGGLFAPTQCYQYATASAELFRTGSGFPKSASNDCQSSSHPWDGNLLNYVSMRRIDVVKTALMGGKCEGARDNTGKCTSTIPGASPTFVTTPGPGPGGYGTRSVFIPQALLANRTGALPDVPPGTDPVWFHSLPIPVGTAMAFCVDGTPSFIGIGQIGSFSHCTSGETQFQVRVENLTDPTGVIQQMGNKARFGLMVYNRNDGGRLLVEMGDNQRIVPELDTTTPSTDTPLAESLYEAVRYFAQLPPVYNEAGPDYTVAQAKDPYFFQDPWATSPQYVNCCKSSVIMITDGQSTNDVNIPAELQDFAAAFQTPDHDEYCSAYYGGPGNDVCARVGLGNLSGSHYLDDVAYWAHITDLRDANVPIGSGPTVPGNALPGIQNLTIYTFFAYGSGHLLADAAKLGGFDNKDGSNNPDSTVQSCTYPIGSSLGSGTSTSSPKWDVNKDCVPDNYFEATSSKDMTDKLFAAFYGALGQSASATGVAVLGSSASGEGASYQAYFFPTVSPLPDENTNEIRWLGYTQGLFVDGFGHLREDFSGPGCTGPPDGKLVLTHDCIVQLRVDPATGNVLVDRFKDVNGDGSAESPTPYQTVTLREIQPIWEAGQRLALMDPGNRNILTWVDTNNNGKVDTNEVIPFSSTNASTLAPYLRAGVAPFTAQNIIDFVRGNQVLDMRDRVKMVKNSSGNKEPHVWKLGDIVNSSPVVVAAPRERYDIIHGDTTYVPFFQRYLDRRQVVYVGANDGMLHAFNAGFHIPGDDPTTPEIEHGRFLEDAPSSVSAKYSNMRTGPPQRGEELWGFIPYQLLPQLQWLTHLDYTHVDYVDLTPKVTDARIFIPDDDHPNGWGTILIGGMRFGGSCGACEAGTGGVAMTVTVGAQTRTFYSAYFVLDITNPEKDPVLLWSFTDANLGLTTSRPAVMRVSASTDVTDNDSARWLMIVGSGVTTYTGTSGQIGRIYAIDLATGPTDASGTILYSTFSTGDAKASMGDISTLDLNLDYRVDAIYVGSSIDNSSSSPKFIGKLYRLTTGGCTAAPCPTGSWGAGNAPTVLLATFGGTMMGPVTAAPGLSIDDTNALWVYWGTGRYYSDPDKTNTDTQHFFGVKDPVVTGGCTQRSIGNCEQNDLVNISDAVVCIICTAPVDEVTGVSGVTTFISLLSLVANKDGWFTTLPAIGERSLNRPTPFGGIVFFTSFIPSTGDICNSAGDGKLYALFYTTGSAFTSSALGTEAVGSNTTTKRFVEIGRGLPSEVAIQINQQGVGETGATGEPTGCRSQGTAYVQAGGGIKTICGKSALRPWSAIISWRDM